MSYKYLFGPVLSRRLGISLGVDLTPYKICNLNCVYCESGKTTKQVNERNEYVPFKGIIEELDQYLATNPHLDYITFSGAGEPTLNSRLGDIIRYLKNNYPVYKIALITNSILFVKEEIRREVLECDLILPSLDAVTDDIFKKINRPLNNISIDKVVKGLIELRKIFKGKIWLEIFIIPEINDSEKELKLIKEKLLLIKADKIQINTLDRPGTENWVIPLSSEQLDKIKKIFLPLNVEIISKNYLYNKIPGLEHEKVKLILSTIKRRPCTLEELSNISGLEINDMNILLEGLVTEKKIKKNNLPGGAFYSIK